MDLKEEIKQIFNGEIEDSPEIIKKYSRDASIFEIKPRLILYPKDTQDLKNLVIFTSQNRDRGVYLTPRSGGTDMTGGAVGESLIVDMTKHFAGSVEISDSEATVNPGVFYRDFEKVTLAQGLLLPSYPASKDICTVGGMVANNAGGEKTLAYGKTEDYVKELKVILSNGNEYTLKPLNRSGLEEKIKMNDFEGNLYKSIYNLIEEDYDLITKARPNVSKNSAGYYLWNVWNRQTFDLTKLFVGSQGTLGIISQIKFKLIKPRKHSKLLIIFLKNLDQLTEIVDKVMEFRPESFESYDDNTFKLALKYFPEIVKFFSGKNVLSLAWQFMPEIWMTITRGIPKLVLMAEFTADQKDDLDKKIKEARKAISVFNIKSRITKNDKDAQKYWTIRRQSFNLLRKHIRGRHTVPAFDDVIVPREKLKEFLTRLNAIMKQYDLTYTIAGHVGNANFHIIPLMDFKDPKTENIIFELMDKVFSLVIELKGSITAEHNDGLIRGPYLEKMYGKEIYSLFERVKKIFDPDNIFNPSKKIGVSLEYAKSHVEKD